MNRLYALKSTFPIKQSALVCFCLESASTLCGTAFDHPDDAIKLSGLNNKDYNRQKNGFDTSLNLKRQLQLKDICLQLELPQTLQSNAQHLLNAYKISEKFTDDIQSAHCLTMAVYQCCKRQKIKSVKSKLSALSGLDSGQWKRFEIEWNEWMVSAEPLKEKLSAISNIDIERHTADVHTENNSAQSSVKIVEEKIQSYEDWKASMLAKARAMIELKKQNDASHNDVTIE